MSHQNTGNEVFSKKCITNLTKVNCVPQTHVNGTNFTQHFGTAL